MAYNRRKNLYFLDRCIRCGELPLYVIFYHDQAGFGHSSVLRSTFRNIKKLLRQRQGFTDLEQYGHSLYQGHSKEFKTLMQQMLKARYDFDLDKMDNRDLRLY